MTRGVRNNNPGNIRITSNPWKGKVVNNTDGSFEQFIGVEYGLRALFILLINYYRSGLRSVSSIVKKYAPSVENDTQNYIKRVAEKMGVDPNEDFPLTKNNLFLLVDGICWVENNAIYTSGLLERGFELLPESKKKELNMPASVQV